MKKIILVVLLALGLNGSEVACKMAENFSTKHAKLIVYAVEREDWSDYEVQIDLTLKWVDRALVECAADWSGRKEGEKVRATLLRLRSGK